MPTYRNDGRSVLMVNDEAGNPVRVKPGSTVATLEIQADADLVKTSDEPFFNPLVARHEVVFTEAGAETVSLTSAQIALADVARVGKVVGANVSVYLNSRQNTPALAVLRPGDSVEADLARRVEALVLVADAAGSCEVLLTVEV